MLFGIEGRPKCVSLQRPDVGFTQCAFHGDRVGNDVDQALSRVTTAPKIVVLPARSAQEARETFKFRCLESRGLCPVPKQNRVDRTDAIDTDLTVLVDGTPFRYRICPDVNRRPDKLIGLGLTDGADAREEPPRSPNLMVPKQSFETMRPVLPSVAYSMAFAFLVIAKFPSPEAVGRWHVPFEMEGVVDLVGSVWPLRRRHRRREGSPGVVLCSNVGSYAVGSRHDRSRFIDRSLLPVADQHVAARGRKLWTIFLEARQNGKIALINQLAAETLHVGRASLLLLVRAAMSQSAGPSQNRQQDKRQVEFTHCVASYRLQTTQRLFVHGLTSAVRKNRPFNKRYRIVLYLPSGVGLFSWRRFESLGISLPRLRSQARAS
jgi:hypothetical protein